MKQFRHLSVGARFGTTIGCLICATIFSSAWAQSAPDQGQATAQEGGEITLNEVTITAEKVSEDIEKAPLAVTAITGAEIVAVGATTPTDLSTMVPNFTAAPNSNGSTIAIRGIVSTAQTLTGDSEVSYSEDGVNMISKLYAFQGMYDVSRVEVLRGPQGTLYGANSNAGAINVVTNKPDLATDSASGSISFGNYNAISTTAVLNMPLSDTLGIRFAANQDYHEGYINLTTNSSRFDDADFVGGRVHLLWKPADNFSALLSFEASHSGGSGYEGAGSGAPLGLYVSQQGISPYAYAAMPSPPRLEWPVKGATLTLNYSSALADVSFISNVHWGDWTQSTPETIYGPDAEYCQNTVAPSQCFNPLIVHQNDRQDSDELRVSKSAGPFQWLVGLYHVRDAYNFNIQFEPAPFNAAEWAELYVGNYYEEDNAAFGQLVWNMTDKFSVVGGLRYQRDVKAQPNDSGFASAPIGSFTGEQCTDCSTFAEFNGYGKWYKFTWHAGLNYNLTPDSFLFASVATGYESGGFANGATIPFNPTYGPENLTNYEIGWKNELFNHRAQLNLDVFYMNYTGYQITSSILASNGNYETVVLNAAKAHIQGVEFESAFLLTPQDKVSFYATYLNAYFNQFYLPLGDGYVSTPGGIGPTDYTGNQLPNAPHATARLSYEHTFPLGNTDSLLAHVDSFYSDTYNTDYHDFWATRMDTYTRTNAWLTWQRTRNDKTFRTQVFVRNIENKAVLAGGQSDNSAPGFNFNAYGKNGYYLPPRTYGVSFSVSL
jgi:iron complex outermembrane recepter protein